MRRCLCGGLLAALVLLATPGLVTAAGPGRATVRRAGVPVYPAMTASSEPVGALARAQRVALELRILGAQGQWCFIASEGEPRLAGYVDCADLDLEYAGPTWQWLTSSVGEPGRRGGWSVWEQQCRGRTPLFLQRQQGESLEECGTRLVDLVRAAQEQHAEGSKVDNGVIDVQDTASSPSTRHLFACVRQSADPSTRFPPCLR